MPNPHTDGISGIISEKSTANSEAFFTSIGLAAASVPVEEPPCSRLSTTREGSAVLTTEEDAATDGGVNASGGSHASSSNVSYNSILSGSAMSLCNHHYYKQIHREFSPPVRFTASSTSFPAMALPPSGATAGEQPPLPPHSPPGPGRLLSPRSDGLPLLSRDQSPIDNSLKGSSDDGKIPTAPMDANVADAECRGPTLAGAAAARSTQMASGYVDPTVDLAPILSSTSARSDDAGTPVMRLPSVTQVDSEGSVVRGGVAVDAAELPQTRRGKKRPPSLFASNCQAAVSSPTVGSPHSRPVVPSLFGGAAAVAASTAEDHASTAHSTASSRYTMVSHFSTSRAGPVTPHSVSQVKSQFSNTMLVPPHHRGSDAARPPLPHVQYAAVSSACGIGSGGAVGLYSPSSGPTSASAAGSLFQPQPPPHRRRRRRGPLVRLSRDRQVLVAGVFRVCAKGCLTVRNFLLLNPRRIDAYDVGGPALSTTLPFSSPTLPHHSSPRGNGESLGPSTAGQLLLPQERTPVSAVEPLVEVIAPGPLLQAPNTPNMHRGALSPYHGPSHPRSSGTGHGNSSFTLLSTSMDTPYSPITYSMDGRLFPRTTGGGATSSRGTLLRAARDELSTRTTPNHMLLLRSNDHLHQNVFGGGRFGGSGKSSSSVNYPGSTTTAVPAALTPGYHFTSPIELSSQGAGRELQRRMGSSEGLCHAGSSSSTRTVAATSPNGVASSDFTNASSLLPYADFPRKFLVVGEGCGAQRLPANAVLYSDLDIKAPVGEGASASVFVSIHRPTGRRLAVKRVDLSPLCLNMFALDGDPELDGSGGSRGDGVDVGSRVRRKQRQREQYERFIGSCDNGRVRQLQHIVIRELQVLHLTYRSPFMVKVYNAFYLADLAALDIVMEFMHYGSLDHLMAHLQNHSQEQWKLREQRQDSAQCLSAPPSPVTSPVNLWLPTTADTDAVATVEGLGSPFCTVPMAARVVPLSSLQTPLNETGSPFPCASPPEASGLYAPHSLDSPRDNYSLKSDVGTEDEADRLSNSDCGEDTNTVEEPFGVAERVVAVVGEQLLRGVRDMHGRGYIHRDIKPGNVLVNEHGVIKLSDFGLSQRCDSSGTGIVNPNINVTAVPTQCNTPVQSPLYCAIPAPVGTVPRLCGTLPDQDGCSATPNTSTAAVTRAPGDIPADLDVADASSTSNSGSEEADTNEAGAADVTGLMGTISKNIGGQPYALASALPSSDDEEDLHCSGTDKYMSPERQRGEPHGMPSDIWAVGVTLAEFAVGQYPYDLTEAMDSFERMQRMGAPVDVARFNAHRFVPLSVVFQDFIRLATLSLASDRPTAKELLEHPFFRQWSTPFDLKGYLSCRVPVPSNEYKEQYRLERERARQAEVEEEEAMTAAEAMGDDSTTTQTHAFLSSNPAMIDTSNPSPLDCGPL